MLVSTAFDSDLIKMLWTLILAILAAYELKTCRRVVLSRARITSSDNSGFRGGLEGLGSCDRGLGVNVDFSNVGYLSSV
eukprot:744290-Amorphochlora_amoeboformis.AAC.1